MKEVHHWENRDVELILPKDFEEMKKAVLIRLRLVYTHGMYLLSLKYDEELEKKFQWVNYLIGCFKNAREYEDIVPLFINNRLKVNDVLEYIFE